MGIKVSDAVAKLLVENDIQHAFGIVGAACAHLFDSIYHQEGLELICTHHEQTATMALQSYYRTAGRPAVAIVTAGAGSSNAITGVLSAWADSLPGIIISGNENSRFTRNDNPLRMYGVQGYDSAGMVSSITKYAVCVTDPKQVLREIQKAIFMATTGRPGPCWIDIPMDVQSAVLSENDFATFDPATDGDASTLFALTQPSDELSSEVTRIYQALRDAKRPLLWLGQGIRLAGAHHMLPHLLDMLGIPALVSWGGIDMLDSNHPLVYGRAGVYGQRAANFILQNCDYLLTIGTRLAIPQVGYDITELARDARISMVDIDPTELGKYSERFETIVQSDAGIFLRALADTAETSPTCLRSEWVSLCNEYRDRYPWVGPEHTDRDGFINSYPFIDRLNSHLKHDQIIVTDMGTALLSGHQVLRVKPPQRLMTSQGLGEMGFGLPAAIGASIARGRGEVLCLNCDGGMMMNLQELQTIVHHRLPIKIVVFNNDGYLMIKHTQNALFKGRYSGTNVSTGVSCPDFSALATAFGIPSFRIRTWKDFDSELPAFQQIEGPALCEVYTHPEQPLVPKLSLAVRHDGTLVSPPLEDLSPLLRRDEMSRNMLSGMHVKSRALSASADSRPRNID